MKILDLCTEEVLVFARLIMKCSRNNPNKRVDDLSEIIAIMLSVKNIIDSAVFGEFMKLVAEKDVSKVKISYFKTADSEEKYEISDDVYENIVFSAIKYKKIQTLKEWVCVKKQSLNKKTTNKVINYLCDASKGKGILYQMFIDGVISIDYLNRELYSILKTYFVRTVQYQNAAELVLFNKDNKKVFKKSKEYINEFIELLFDSFTNKKANKIHFLDLVFYCQQPNKLLNVLRSCSVEIKQRFFDKVAEEFRLREKDHPNNADMEILLQDFKDEIGLVSV